MPVVKNLMVRAGADFSPITKQAQRAQKSMQTMQQRVGRSCGLMQSAMGGLKRVMGALGVALSVGAIVNAAKDAKAAYDEAAAAEARLAQVMRNTMGARAADIASIKDLAEAQQRLGVVEADVQIAGAQELATYLSQKKSLETLIPVMNDMIAQQYGYNATAENAVNIATMMGKVMDGQTGALSRYGYTFTEAQAAVLEYGDEAQRAATLAEVVSASVGGMNQALASTPTGRIQQLKNTLGDIKEQFGQAVTNILATFLPALQAVARVLADVATLANRVAQAVANVFGSGGTAQAAIIGYGGAAAGAVGEIGGATEEAAESAEKLATAGFDTLQKLSGSSSGASGGAASDSDSGSGGISTIVEDSGEAAETVGWLESGLKRIKEIVSSWDTSKLATSFERLKQAAQPFVTLIGDGLKWAWDNVLVPVGKWVVEEAGPASLDALATAIDFLRTVAKKLQPAWQWLWDHVISPVATALGSAITTAIQTITTVLQDLTALLNGEKSFDDLQVVIAIRAWWADTKEKIKQKWADITSGVTEVKGKIVTWWSNTKEKITQKWQNITSGVTEVKGKIRTWWVNTKSAVTEKWNNLVSGVKEVRGTVRTWWINTKSAVTEKWNNLVSGVKEVRGTVRTWWINTKSAVTEKWNNLVSGVKEVRGTVRTWWINTKSAVTEKWNNLVSGVKEVRGTVRTWWINTKSAVTEKWNNLVSGVKEKTGTIRAWWADTKAQIEEKWNNLTAPVKGFTAPIYAKIATVWGDIKRSWFDLIEPMVNFKIKLTAEIATKIADLKNWINTSIIDPLNVKIQNAHIGSWYPLKNVSIPHLAQGGYLRANNPMLAVVGDNREQGEIVSPESKLRAMAEEAARAVLQGTRMAMSGAADIRTPVDIPSILRTIMGFSGGFGMNIGGIGDDAMTLLRRILRAVEDGQVITVDRRVLGQVLREDNRAVARATGAVTRVR